MPDIPIPQLQKLLLLDADTGALYWRTRPVDLFSDGAQSAEMACHNWNSRWSGKEAFTAVDGKGYRRGQINGRKYAAHRVVFALANGRWPTHMVDHANGIPQDNRPGNLREATRSQNAMNVKSHRDGASLYLGVCWDKNAGKWKASIRSAGKTRYLGLFLNEADAARAYDAAAKRVHGDFARLNFKPQSAA